MVIGCLTINGLPQCSKICKTTEQTAQGKQHAMRQTATYDKTSS